MVMTFLQRRVPLAGTITGFILTLALSPEAFAFPVAPTHDLVTETQVIDVRHTRQHVYRGRGNTGTAAALGILTLGIGAVIANSARYDEFDPYYPAYNYPVYGYPAYGYPQQHYDYEGRRLQGLPRGYRDHMGSTYPGGKETYWQRKNREDRDKAH